MSEKVTVDLTGPAKTMLTTLYLKALDADFEAPVLGDTYAKDAVSKLDFDWDDLKVTGMWAPIVTVRSAQYDIWARAFLAEHPQATVIHTGCGLDARVFRLDPGPGVKWFDVDYPEVIALRDQIYPDRPGYRMVATSATDASWLDAIDTGQPLLFVAEGISMYLTAREGVDLLTRMVRRFGRGEIQMDFYNWLAIRSQRVHAITRRSGSTLHWTVNSPEDVLVAVPALRLVESVTVFDASTAQRAAKPFRTVGRLVRAVPPLRKSLQYHRYAFGQDS